jgi:hypothetical protein
LAGVAKAIQNELKILSRNQHIIDNEERQSYQTIVEKTKQIVQESVVKKKLLYPTSIVVRSEDKCNLGPDRSI